MNVPLLPGKTRGSKKVTRSGSTDSPIWDPALGPDRSTITMATPPRHTRTETPVSYAPARDIPIAPEKSTGRSTCYYLDPIDGLIKVAESQLEFNACLRFMADRSVIRLEPQFGPVHYVNAEGRRTYTVFDQRASFVDHTKSVVSVKPLGRATKQGTEALNRLILDQMPVEDADRVQLVTEQDLPQWATANNRLIQSVRNDHHWRCYAEMAGAAAAMKEPASIDEFAKPWGGSKIVFRTVVMLIFEGVLRQVEPGEIDDATIIANALSEEIANESKQVQPDPFPRDHPLRRRGHRWSAVARC